MIYDKKIKKIFTYPKLTDLVNPTTKEDEVPLDQEIRVWLNDILKEYFDDGIKKISYHRIRPWSKVFKVETKRNGLYFLKIPASEFSHEGQIIEAIERYHPDVTIKVLARNKTNGSFLMAAFDEETLRSKLRKHFDESILVDSAAKIGKFQKDAREYISEFEQLGIPKWTSGTIIEYCELLIKNPRFLIHTGLSGKDIAAYRSLFPFIREKISILTMFDNGLSIEHGDFQDNNILISKNGSLFIDWGDANISTPSFTIGTYCHSIILAYPNLINKPIFIQNILAKFYLNLLGRELDELHECHIPLVHLLYPMICILKTGRLFNLEDKKTDKYASTIVDYWIRIVISFTDAYCDKSLCNKIA
jgi:thiamine kinase-like enzyme